MKQFKLLASVQARLFVALVALTLVLSGCGHDTVIVDEPTVGDAPSVLLPQAGDVFLTTGFRIKTIITPQTVATFDPLTFEVYVDGKGQGTGLLGYKDKVYDVVITGDQLHVKMADSVAIQVKDFTGHIIPSSVKTQGVQDMTTLGFNMLDGHVAGYKYSDSQFIIDGTYQLSDATFDASTITAGNIMTLNEMINYILSVEQVASPGATTSGDQTKPADPESNPGTTDNPLVPNQGSFWNNSDIGVTIHDKIYSIGDFCNPYTYYEEQIPERMAPRYTYNKDERVELLDINYQSTEGRTSFMTTEGYVHTIATTCDFQWLSIYKGQMQEEMEGLIGAKLKKDQQETFVPMVEGLHVLESKNKSYLLELGDLRITIDCGQNDKKEKIVTGITVTRPIVFD